MIFVSSSTSAYDENEIYLVIETEIGETIKVGDSVTIPMNDRSFERREITGMYRDWKKRKKGKENFTKIHDGEWAECIIHGIHSGKIHTISSLYDDEPHEGAVMASSYDWNDDVNNQLQVFMNFEGKSAFPKLCPICGHQSGHLYYHLHRETRAGIWVWCSNCKAFAHYSGHAPTWWQNPPFIELGKLCAVPDYLEENSDSIDKWINDLLNVGDKTQ